ncbi:MAG TPA: TPM domain-containing protein [Verrucomicrobiota bacterium]|nr:TPM domain-containing protein [Verrucomicrobiota bacterium]
MKDQEFIKQLEDNRIVNAIRDAELKTSGEIRVVISGKNVDDAVAAAQSEFVRLGMGKTQERNGVLVFVAPRARQFAVIGDEGIHKHCGEDFWRGLAAEMTGQFKDGRYTDGLVAVVRKAGELLALHFPRRADDRNELPDRVQRD